MLSQHLLEASAGNMTFKIGLFQCRNGRIVVFGE
jgi:hypothetical protein